MPGSVAHLDDDERAVVLGVLLEEALTWVHSLRGSARFPGPMTPSQIRAVRVARSETEAAS